MILIGYSGHSYVVNGIFSALGKKVSGYFDNEEKAFNPFGLQYLGTEKSPEAVNILSKDEFFIAVGDNTTRKSIFNKLAENNILPVNAIHPSAVIDPSAMLSTQGIMINSNVSVNALAKIGKGVICNTGSIVEHECVVGDFVHVGPGTVLCGNVTIGECSYIGANSVVRQGITIGKNCMIGAGAVILKNVPDNTCIIGNPGREMRQKEAEKANAAIGYVENKSSSEPSKLKILFIGKSDDPYSKYAGDYVCLLFPKTLAIYGKRGEEFPQAAKEWKGDIVISYLSQWIIPGEVLNNAAMMAINFHPGPPEYPGIGCTNFAVYHGVKEYGVTCHHMLEKVDTGKIIAVRRFPVFEQDTVYAITQRCYSLILNLFYEIFDHIKQGLPIPETNETWKRKPYLRKELNRLCRITPDMDIEEINRRIKATNFVKHWAFMQVGNNVFKLIDDKK